MQKINIVSNTLDVKEIVLQVTGTYIPSEISHTIDCKTKNITITIDTSFYTEKIYGREIKGKYYFARVEHISKNIHDEIQWYDEFFCNGSELKF